MPSDLCLQCKKNPVESQAERAFCSKECTEEAAKSAPGFLEVPKSHILYTDVIGEFKEQWRGKAPEIKALYLATWTESMRESFERYRSKIQAEGHLINECQLFRGAERACTVGENTTEPCNQSCCKLCVTIRNGFAPRLQEKLSITDGVGINLGAGLYTSSSANMAASFAKNIGSVEASRVKVLMLCRVILGQTHVTTKKDITLKKPPEGYDSVQGIPAPSANGEPDFTDDEHVVYDIDAIRLAYLIVFTSD